MYVFLYKPHISGFFDRNLKMEGPGKGKARGIPTDHLSSLPKFTRYCVDFSPEVELVDERKMLIKENKSVLGFEGYLFDGTILTLVGRRLEDDYSLFQVRRKDGSAVLICLEYACVLDNATAIRIYDRIIRRIVEGLQLQPIDRNILEISDKTALFHWLLICHMLWLFPANFRMDLNERATGIQRCKNKEDQ